MLVWNSPGLNFSPVFYSRLILEDQPRLYYYFTYILFEFYLCLLRFSPQEYCFLWGCRRSDTYLQQVSMGVQLSSSPQGLVFVNIDLLFTWYIISILAEEYRSSVCTKNRNCGFLIFYYWNSNERSRLPIRITYN